jgi:hypothetical protein
MNYFLFSQLIIPQPLSLVFIPKLKNQQNFHQALTKTKYEINTLINLQLTNINAFTKV